MKKIIGAAFAVALVLTSSISVFAAEDEVVTSEVVCNMDAETFEETRLAQIDEALANGLITEEQAALLKEHILEVIADEAFGNGPTGGYQGEGNEDCVLGDGLNLGIFRSENAGVRAGDGTGVGIGSGQGTRGANRGTGLGTGNNGVCILD